MSTSLRLALIIVVFAACSTLALAQNNGNNGGIHIDADGVVTMAIQNDRGGKLDKKLRAALAKQAVPGDVSQPSSQRMVSLVRLEDTCGRLLAEKKSLPPEVACLAGLTQIDHIFVDSEGKDLILSGPAEPFAKAESGRWIGLETGRPVLRLDDLVVALRSVTQNQLIGCSIDPVPERHAKLQQFIQANSTPAVPAVIEQRYRKMVEVLGNHTVRIMGVPHDSHFARGLVEADYRMKLLTLGLEKPGVKGFKSHLAMVNAAQASQRWWFVPLYDRILRAQDGLAFEFSGQRAQLMGEDELSNDAGQRAPAATNKVSTQEYSKQFTEKFPQLAANMPVFAELQQLIDWTVFAALVRQEGLATRIGWSMALFADANKLPHEAWPVPKEVAGLLNTKVGRGGLIVGEFAGGVTIQPGGALRQFSVREDQSGELTSRRTEALDRTGSEDHPWWWD